MVRTYQGFQTRKDINLWEDDYRIAIDEEKILNNLEQERLTVGYSWDLLQRSLEYAYSIGVSDGKKLIGHGKPVGQFKDGLLINKFLSASEASRSVHLTKTAVMKCLAGKIRKCAGYEWKYVTD